MDGADDAALTEYKASARRDARAMSSSRSEISGRSSLYPEPSANANANARRPAVPITIWKKKVAALMNGSSNDSNGYAEEGSKAKKPPLRRQMSKSLSIVLQDATPGEVPRGTPQPTASDAATSPGSSRVIGRARRELSRTWRPHAVMYLLSAIMLLYALVRSFSPEPVGLLRADAACTNAPLFKCLCPRKTVCAEDWPSLFLLALARGSAYMDYPLYAALFLTKCHNLRSALGGSYLSEWLPFHDLHKLHVFAGWVVGVETFSHSIAHMVRWSLQGNANFLFTTQTGRTGFLALLCTPLIVWPMALNSLRVRYRWETRKTLHYLSLVWGICVACHAPATHVAWVMGTVVFLYCADILYGFMFKIKLVSTARFIRLENCVEMSFDHPYGFSSDGTGYVLVCLPWISKSEWHAFSLFKHSKKDNSSAVCIAAIGDWTKKLHDALDRPTVRHAWIVGPYASPYSTSIRYDNLLCVATGIGITPAISIVTMHGSGSSDRRVHLIWICRDPSLIEFYLKSVSFDSRGWALIYYTGKSRPLLLDSEDLPPSVLIFRKRPNLERVTADIIYGIEGGHGLPEKLLAKAKDFRNEIFRGNQEGARLEKLLIMIVQVHGRDAFFDMCSMGDRSSSCFKQRRSSFDLVESNKSDKRPLTPVTASTAIPSRRQAWQSNDELQEGQYIDISQQITNENHYTMTLAGFKTTFIQLAEALAHQELSEYELELVDVMYENIVCCDGTERSEIEQHGIDEVGKLKFDIFVTQTMNKSGNNMGENDELDMSVRNGNSSPSGRIDVPGKKMDAIDFLGNPVNAATLKAWQIMYCGGAQPVVDELSRISQPYGISLEVEKFDW